VEGLALKVADGSITPNLQDISIYAVDMSSIIAGTKYRGDFEKKLKSLIKEIQEIEDSVLFIDEIHTIVGAGASGNSSMDASNILKPFLSSGKLRCIGATTFVEYRNDFSKDKALSRRFSKLDINEPSIDNCITILEGLKAKYEEFHNVEYTTKAISKAVELSHQYITDKFLPDSAIDVIDEVGAIAKLQNNKHTISTKDIEDAEAKIAHIPSQNIAKSDMAKIKNLEKNMKKVVFGQDEAIEKVIKAIKINKAGLNDTNRPIGSFLFTGPTGVGKTEVAKELANQFDIHFERFDMSEYAEAHSISRLIGAPAGYVGHEKGGLLTEAIKKHPHTVLLLDEIEKAHIDLMSILLQVMDNATLTDNNGEKVDFQNVILILTSNLGAKSEGVMGFNSDDSLNQDSAIKSFFAPEFRNRLDATISFAHLSSEIVSLVVAKFVDRLVSLLSNKNINIKLTKKAKSELARLGYDKQMGARPLQRVISKYIKEVIANEILFGKLKIF
jgi:ATP-dependent Clp protease ATP-binding subunit ClpA